MGFRSHQRSGGEMPPTCVSQLVHALLLGTGTGRTDTKPARVPLRFGSLSIELHLSREEHAQTMSQHRSCSFPTLLLSPFHVFLHLNLTEHGTKLLHSNPRHSSDACANLRVNLRAVVLMPKSNCQCVALVRIFTRCKPLATDHEHVDDWGSAITV